MKRLTTVCALALALTMALAPAAHAAEWADPAQVCYPTSVTRNEDGTEIRKILDQYHDEFANATKAES